MGRELKRVPLSFNWPLDKPYEGFLNPFYDLSSECPHCKNGYSPEYARLESLWYSHQGGGFKPEDRGSVPYRPDDPLVQRIIRAKIARSYECGYSFYGQTDADVMDEAIRMCGIWNSSWSHHLNQDDVQALLDADRLWDFTRVPRTEKQRALVAKRVASGKHNSWLPRSNGHVPTAKEVNDWSLEGFGHDSCNSWIVLEAECKRKGWPTTCAHCDGEGRVWPDKATKTRYNRWRKKEPPKGVGYQIWETVSEGSPVSPVCKHPEDLANWMVANDDSVTRSTTYDQWMKFILGPGWAPSFVCSPATGVLSGVAAG